MPRRLHVERQGRGRRVVLVHGFTQTAASWHPVATRLAGRFEVLAPDCPGHGRSSAVAAADLPHAAALVTDAAGGGAYVGYSMGGRICLRAALDRPAEVRALVLVSATAGIEDEQGRAERRRADAALADRLDPPGGGTSVPLRQWLEEWLAGPLFAHLPPDAAALEARLSSTADGLATSLRTVGTGSMEPLWHRLAALRMPLLVVAGAEDGRFVAHAERLAAAVEGAALEIVAGAGHAVPFEVPQRFAEIVEGFLDDVRARSRPRAAPPAPAG